MNARTLSVERRREREERVEQCIPEELLTLWHRVNRSIRGGTEHQRFKAFMQFVHDHPEERFEAEQAEADRCLHAELLEKEAREGSGTPALGKPRWVVYLGAMHRVTKLAHMLGIGGGTLGQRINRGWPEERWGEPPRGGALLPESHWQRDRLPASSHAVTCGANE